MLFLTKYESNLIAHGNLITMVWGQGAVTYLKTCQNFMMTKFLLTFTAGQTFMGGVKNKWGVIFITILLHFHYFISLETASNEKNEVFLLKISLDIHNASGVTCQYPQIFNSSFRKEFLEILC